MEAKPTTCQRRLKIQFSICTCQPGGFGDVKYRNGMQEDYGVVYTELCFFICLVEDTIKDSTAINYRFPKKKKKNT